MHTMCATEIAAAEAELVRSGVPVEEIQNLCDAHATLFEARCTGRSFEWKRGIRGFRKRIRY